MARKTFDMAQNGKQGGNREIVIPSRFLGVRAKPHAQRALNDVLDAGIARDQTEAVELGLERLGKIARRVKRRAA